MNKGVYSSSEVMLNSLYESISYPQYGTVNRYGLNSLVPAFDICSDSRANDTISDEFTGRYSPKRGRA